MHGRNSVNSLDDADRIARESRFTTAEARQLLNACDGDLSRARVAARMAARLGWTLAEVLRLQGMMKAKLEAIEH
jgi:hypothetical protein